jgi:antitoxin VapB
LRQASAAIIFMGRQNLPERPVMPLNIKDESTERAVRELAALTGETVTTTVRRAAEERLQRVRRGRAGGSLAAELLAIGQRCAALPDIDQRTPDEILGYDEHGLPA